MNYIVLETQTNNGATALVPPLVYTDLNEAKRAYHLGVASAVVSAVEAHTIILMTSEGQVISREVCRHISSAEPESEN